MVNKYNQHKKIKDYIDRNGSITPMEAFSKLHITKLATRIGEMIKDGYEVRKIMESKINEEGTIVRYMRYVRVNEDA